MASPDNSLTKSLEALLNFSAGRQCGQFSLHDNDEREMTDSTASLDIPLHTIARRLSEFPRCASDCLIQSWGWRSRSQS